MNASLENTTRPMRSYFLSLMKSAMISFAAPNLCGSKSVSPMLPDTSRAMAMSTPSPRDYLPRIGQLRSCGGNDDQGQRQKPQHRHEWH